MDTYRGSPKHKNRPGTGRKGTLCPEWTHTVSDQDFSSAPFDHDWQASCAHKLFASAIATSNNRRYATARGIAFEAKPTGDGTWHGYPVPWESVPPPIFEQWLRDMKVTKRDLRLNRHHETTNIHWALGTDEP